MDSEPSSYTSPETMRQVWCSPCGRFTCSRSHHDCCGSCRYRRPGFRSCQFLPQEHVLEDMTPTLIKIGILFGILGNVPVGSCVLAEGSGRVFLDSVLRFGGLLCAESLCSCCQSQKRCLPTSSFPWAGLQVAQSRSY